MGLELRSSTIDASNNAIGWVCPIDATGLVYANFFGGTATTTARNLAFEGEEVEVVGNPVENAKYTLFKPGVNFVRTASLETADKTLIIVCRPVSENKSRIIGTYRGDRPGNEAVLSNGVNIWLGLGTTTGDNLLTATYDDAGWSGTLGSISNSIPISLDNSVSVGQWCCLIGKTTSNVRKFFNKTANVSATSANTTQVDLSASAYEIGSTRGFTGYDSNIDLAFAAIFERALSDVEITKMYDFLKAYMASYALPILI